MKKRKTLLVACILSFLTVGVTGCDKDEESIPSTLFKTWILTGFVDGETGDAKTPEPDGTFSYLLTFRSDNWLEGYTSTNEVFGQYALDNLYNEQNFWWYGKMQISAFSGTELIEILDGERYVKAILSVNSFTLSISELKLYYGDGKDYLLFRSTVSR